jgi:hypothetical protein
MTIKILGVGSSMREGSYGTRTLKTVLDAAGKHEAKTDITVFQDPFVLGGDSEKQ